MTTMRRPAAAGLRRVPLRLWRTASQGSWPSSRSTASSTTATPRPFPPAGPIQRMARRWRRRGRRRRRRRRGHRVWPRQSCAGDTAWTRRATRTTIGTLTPTRCAGQSPRKWLQRGWRRRRRRRQVRRRVRRRVRRLMRVLPLRLLRLWLDRPILQRPIARGLHLTQESQRGSWGLSRVGSRVGSDWSWQSLRRLERVLHKRRMFLRRLRRPPRAAAHPALRAR